MPIRRDIALQRNESFAEEWTLRDADDQPIELTGKTVALQVKDRLNNSTIIQSADIEVMDESGGVFDYTLSATAGNALHLYGDALHTYQLPYDLVVTEEADGFGVVLQAGYVILSRGVTQ